VPKSLEFRNFERLSLCGIFNILTPNASLHRQNHPAAVGGILDSGGFAAIFAGLEFPVLLYLQRFAGKNPGFASCRSGHPTSVHRRRMRPENGEMHLQDLPLIPPPQLSRR
jgi:hypothetical protein